MSIENILNNSAYSKQYEWAESLSFNIEDGTTFKTGRAFFEAMNEKSIFRGDAKTLQEAEKIAWDKYNKTINCEHDFIRKQDTGYACCSKCDLKGEYLKNIQTCIACTNPHFDYVGSDSFCIKHYPSFLVKYMDENDILCSELKELSLSFHLYLTKNNLLNEQSPHEDIKNIYNKNIRTCSSMILDIADDFASLSMSKKRTQEELRNWSIDFEKYSNNLKLNENIATLFFESKDYNEFKDKCLKIYK